VDVDYAHQDLVNFKLGKGTLLLLEHFDFAHSCVEQSPDCVVVVNRLLVFVDALFQVQTQFGVEQLFDEGEHGVTVQVLGDYSKADAKHQRVGSRNCLDAAIP
jgi:hypothetical protein